MGRPRSERAHRDVLDAALDLFAERGLDATSMDAIAEASGVSKATIYKHWPDKDALCLEVLARLHGREGSPPDIDTGHIRSDLIEILSWEPPAEHARSRMRLMPHLMAYAARNFTFGKAWKARVVDPPRVQLRRAIERGIARGELTRDLDVELAMALLLGPRMYAQTLKLAGGRIPGDLPKHLVDAFLRSWKKHERVFR